MSIAIPMFSLETAKYVLFSDKLAAITVANCSVL